MFGALCGVILKLSLAPQCVRQIRYGVHLICPCSFRFVGRKKMYATSRRPDDFMYVAFPDKPAYFTNVSESNETNKDGCASDQDVSDIVCSGKYKLLVIEPQISEEDKLLKYMKTAIISQRIIRALPDFNGGISLCFSSNPGGLQRGVCVYIDKEGNIPTDITEIAKQHDVKFYFHFRNKGDGKFMRTTCDLADENVIEERNFFLSVQQPESSIFSVPDYTPVFHDYTRTKMILEKLQVLDMPEVAELLEIANRLVPRDLRVEDLQQNMEHPFVVVEGMDATGKTTLTKILGDRLSAVWYYTPPPPIEHLRPFFDRMPELVRRAYYSVGNYIVAMEISKECKERAVIMDRYWHSTAAYGVANETSRADLPRCGHSVYQWPADLLRPTAVLFLTVGEEIRKQRLQGRGIEKTFEEKSLDKDQLFRQRLCDSYRRMEKPSVMEIDASGTVEEVVTSAIDKLATCGVHIPSDPDV